MPRHAQYEYPRSYILFANAWLASRTFVIDLADPAAPKLKGAFDEALGFSFERTDWPHAASGAAEVHAALFRR